MSAYYNEFDPHAAEWLRQLIKQGHIAKGDVDGLVLHRPAVGITDLHPQRVEEHDWIHPVQGPALPFPHLVQNRIGDAADQIG